MSELYFDKKSGEYKPKQPGVIYVSGKEILEQLKIMKQHDDEALAEAKEGTKRLKELLKKHDEFDALLHSVE